MMTRAKFSAAGALLAGAMLAAGAASASAQTASADARWNPWIGCWQNVNGSDTMLRSGPERDRVVCVVPSTGTSAVDILTVDSGRIASREHIDASGERRTVDEGGCTGWRSAQWSGDGHRLYQRSDISCAGGAHRTSSGLFAMSRPDVWLRVHGVGNGEGAGVRVVRYRSAPVPAAVASELAVVKSDSLALSTARLAAEAATSTEDVIEASHQVDAPVVEAWLLERNPDLQVDAKELERLADAGVPARVIDAMVALSYPSKFAIGPTREIALRSAVNPATGYSSGVVTQAIVLDPYGYGPYGLGYYSPFGYGYDPYGYGGGWYPWSGPVIIVRGPSAEHGKLVKGRGYTRGDRGTGDQPGAHAGTSSRSSGGASSGRTSTGRTAKPRP